MKNEVQRTILDNGIVVLAAENPAADIIAARIFLRAGSRCVQPEKAGLCHLLSAVMTKGTDRLSSLEIAERVESVGARLSTDSTTDYFLVSLKTVAADFQNILELAAELMRSPTFPEAEVELERRIAISAIRSQQEQPFAIAFKQLRHAMYKEHPYAFSTLGTEATMSNLTRNDLEQFHKTYFRPDNVVISVAGRISTEDAIALIDRTFKDWKAPLTPIPTLSFPPLSPSPQSVLKTQETQQSVIMLGYLAPSVKNPDYAAIKLLNTYLGNGLSSRLFVELREKRGLAYDVSALYATRLDMAQFVAYMGTAPENTVTAFEGLRTEVDRLANIELSEEELQACKNKMLGQYALGKQTNSQIAQVVGWYEILGLGIKFDQEFQEKIAQVTSSEAQEAAKKYFIEPYVSLVGPEAAITELGVPAVC
ncbi:insulinase family protein [Microcoleus sp. LEGE 07076]|uniref:M16 family metallopeptidase n=1 Tax=Microcoleus sp. LEGE 07076 TaxID=915322 RepID=UPI00187EDFC9|nr:pitrilysin family protein [Microcoleus sp. LEGE 07076]MBE9184554.1 insulinase family protein [Microcoleus sp. LEGE 07076]